MINAATILKALTKDYEGRGYLCFPELRMGTGFGTKAEKRIDLFVFHPFPSKCFHRIAFEIKINKSDFYRDCADNIKRADAVRFANKFYYVTPPGLLKPKAIPSECGLIEIEECRGGLYPVIIVPAPCHDNVPTWKFVASLARRIRKVEQ